MFECQTIEKIQIKKEKEKKYFYIYVPDVYFCLNLFLSLLCTYAFIPDSTRQIGMYAF